MRLLIDTNVIIDCLTHREPFCRDADMLFMLGELGEFELWISSSQVSDIFYILTNGKRSYVEEGKRHLSQLRKHVHICSIGEAEIDAALMSPWEDFEDACLYQAALKIKADAIITRNQKDFTRSSIYAFTGADLFEYLKTQKGIEYITF